MDKDILAIIAEMLKKQDQTHDTITAFMGAATEYAKGINNQIGNTNQQIREGNERITRIGEQVGETNTILKEFMGVSIKQWEQQHIFNERFYDKLDNIDKVFTRVASLEERVKHLEDLEERLIKVERLLKAS